jgi:activator of HSP90 ATPase
MPRNLIIAASLPATPDTLFEMYLDPGAHAAFTGSPVTIEPRPGSPFRAFGGSLSGTMLHVEPKRLIVQTWR